MTGNVSNRPSNSRAGQTGVRVGIDVNNLRRSSSRSLETSGKEAPRSGRSRPVCCLCWCCYCSWGCLNHGRDNDDGETIEVVNPAEIFIFDDETAPTLEEIRSWGRSFDRLMRSESGRKVFGEFLRLEYSDENILFWLACEDLKANSTPETLPGMVRVIFEEYISILAPREVSLDSRVREIVNRNMVEPTTQAFDEAQAQIYTLMQRDSYPRFINSDLFRALAQEDNEEEAVVSVSPRG